MLNETSRRYLFVAIDRATRSVFMEIYADQSVSSISDFLIKVKDACLITIVKLLTDNGSQFTDRFTSRKKDPVSGDRITRSGSTSGSKPQPIAAPAAA